MVIKPTFDRVFVRKDKPTAVLESGIVIPEFAQESATQGTVIAVGSGKYAEKTGVFIPTTLTVGTKVLFHPCAGSEMTVGSDSFYNMPEGDIWAVIEEDE